MAQKQVILSQRRFVFLRQGFQREFRNVRNGFLCHFSDKSLLGHLTLNCLAKRIIGERISAWAEGNSEKLLPRMT